MNTIYLTSFDDVAHETLEHLVALLSDFRFRISSRTYGEDPSCWFEEEERPGNIESDGIETPPCERTRWFGRSNNGVKVSPHSLSDEEHVKISDMLTGIGEGDIVLTFMDVRSSHMVLPVSFFSSKAMERGAFSICFVLNRGGFRTYSDLEEVNKIYQRLALNFQGIVGIPPEASRNGSYLDMARVVRHLSEMVFCPGIVNLDNADLTIISRGGSALVMTTGIARPGGVAASTSVSDALEGPLCDIDLSDVRKAIVNVIGSRDLTLEDSLVASEVLKRRIVDDARIIWGVTVVDDLDESMEVFIILATTSMGLLSHWYASTDG